ncbi:protein Son-like [Malaya genurostris]|uniref:protein Son-like n=1 Tax=Malaya genurostris TaxID=325434 RepID=UPI0026F3B682|nr:protein Son-like [Malaya genurostris]
MYPTSYGSGSYPYDYGQSTSDSNYGYAKPDSSTSSYSSTQVSYGPSGYVSSSYEPVYSTNATSYSVSSKSAQGYYTSDPVYSSYSSSSYTTVSSGNAEMRKSYINHWVKPNSLRVTAPYSGEKGVHLLQKMGWTPGQGLGKRKDGSLEPHLPVIKMNKRGFDVSKVRGVKKISIKTKGTKLSVVTEGKHPISILSEYCTKRRWELPIYQAIIDEGPIHAKNYLFKVIVKGVEYKGERSSNIKQTAKMEAAKKCLQKLGILNDSCN